MCHVFLFPFFIFSYSPPKNTETTLSPWRCASFASSRDLFSGSVFTPSVQIIIPILNKIFVCIWWQICLNIWRKNRHRHTQQWKAAATSRRLSFCHRMWTCSSYREEQADHVFSCASSWMEYISMYVYTFNDEQVSSSSLLTNLNHMHTSICTEMSPGSSHGKASPVGILQVLDLMLIFFYFWL